MKSKIKKGCRKLAGWGFSSLPYLAVSGIISLVLSEIVRTRVIPRLHSSMILDYLSRKPHILPSEIVIFTLVTICIILSPMAITRNVKSDETIISTFFAVVLSLELPVTFLISIVSRCLSAYFIVNVWVLFFCLLLLIKALFLEIRKWFLETKGDNELSLNKLIFLCGIITVIIGWLLKN